MPTKCRTEFNFINTGERWKYFPGKNFLLYSIHTYTHTRAETVVNFCLTVNLIPNDWLTGYNLNCSLWMDSLHQQTGHHSRVFLSLLEWQWKMTNVQTNDKKKTKLKGRRDDTILLVDPVYHGVRWSFFCSDCIALSSSYSAQSDSMSERCAWLCMSERKRFRCTSLVRAVTGASASISRSVMKASKTLPHLQKLIDYNKGCYSTP